MQRKDFWLLSTVNKVLKEFIPNLSHEADGLIFQVIEEDYWISCNFTLKFVLLRRHSLLGKTVSF